jgi:uncharacterized protein
MRDVQVFGMGLDTSGARPVLLLQETGGARRLLPIWIGLPEATALELAHRQEPAPRPGTHELIGQLIGVFGRRLETVRITAIQEGIYHGELVFDGDVLVSARPSDAVTLALELKVPIQVAEAVLDQAGVDRSEMIDGEPDDAGTGSGATEAEHQAELDRFRQFLDTADPEDFDKN